MIRPVLQIYEDDNAQEIFIKAYNYYMKNNQKREAKIFEKEVKKCKERQEFLSTLLTYFEIEVYRKD